MARTRAPRVVSPCSTADPVFPVAQVTRIRCSASITVSSRFEACTVPQFIGHAEAAVRVTW
jgi:hypothetical protein